MATVIQCCDRGAVPQIQPQHWNHARRTRRKRSCRRRPQSWRSPRTGPLTPEHPFLFVIHKHTGIREPRAQRRDSIACFSAAHSVSKWERGPQGAHPRDFHVIVPQMRETTASWECVLHCFRPTRGEPLAAFGRPRLHSPLRTTRHATSHSYQQERLSFPRVTGGGSPTCAKSRATCCGLLRIAAASQNLNRLRRLGREHGWE